MRPDPHALTLTPGWADALAEQLLSVVHRRYPNKIAHLLQLDTDARPPRQLTPAFWGAFDWHSSVHCHWSLLQLISQPALVEAATTDWPARALAALELALDAGALGAELIYAETGNRGGFELPYGAAWLLALEAAVHRAQHPRREAWLKALSPLASSVKRRFRAWLSRLSHPVRGGEHSQTMFALGLALDSARASGDDALALLIASRAADLHGGDRDLPFHLEPSAFDFLSPGLATADLVRRYLGREPFAAWLDQAAPALGRHDLLQPVKALDPTDGKLVHFDGLNLSRAWMLRAIAAALPDEDPRRAPLTATAELHATRGLAAAITPHFAGSHWLGTFALVWLADPWARA